MAVEPAKHTLSINMTSGTQADSPPSLMFF